MKVVSMRGKTVDMGVLMAKHANMRALGNANMNARGDMIDAKGNVVQKREDLAMQYHTDKQAVPTRTVGIKSLTSEMFASPADAMAAAQKTQAQQVPMGRAVPEAISPAQAMANIKKNRKLLDDSDGGI